MEKLTNSWFMLFLFLFTISSCSGAGQPMVEKDESPIENESLLQGKKILIVYLSRTKNTKTVAEIIQQKVGGNLIELELATPYPENYQQIVAQVAKENEENFLPPLKTSVDNLQEYDIVFIGFPTWGMQLPPPMKSFLNQNNLKGKTIIPFNTNAGYGIGSSMETVKNLCPDSKILEGFSTKGGIERDGILYVMEGDKEKQVQLEIQNWLKDIGLFN